MRFSIKTRQLTCKTGIPVVKVCKSVDVGLILSDKENPSWQVPGSSWETSSLHRLNILIGLGASSKVRNIRCIWDVRLLLQADASLPSEGQSPSDTRTTLAWPVQIFTKPTCTCI